MQRKLYSGVVSQGGGGKTTLARVSVFRPLTK